MHDKFTLKVFTAISLIICTLTSCYRMPTEDDYSVVPLTNNPDFTKEGNSAIQPKMEY